LLPRDLPSPWVDTLLLPHPPRLRPSWFPLVSDLTSAMPLFCSNCAPLHPWGKAAIRQTPSLGYLLFSWTMTRSRLNSLPPRNLPSPWLYPLLLIRRAHLQPSWSSLVSDLVSVYPSTSRLILLPVHSLTLSSTDDNGGVCQCSVRLVHDPGHTSRVLQL
jgi:hypothetical protein